MQVTTIGLDLAKHWFQVHGADAKGRVVVRRRLRRSGVIAFFRSLEQRRGTARHACCSPCFLHCSSSAPVLAVTGARANLHNIRTATLPFLGFLGTRGPRWSLDADR
jgi:hypothetical protein